MFHLKIVKDHKQLKQFSIPKYNPFVGRSPLVAEAFQFAYDNDADYIEQCGGNGRVSGMYYKKDIEGAVLKNFNN